MRSLTAFFKKEITESIRNGKLLITILVFVAIGIMNPAIAKLTPWFMDMFSETLAESGMIVQKIEINALTSWTQFFKNIPIALITFVIIYSGIFTKEYESGTLILIITKGIERHKILVSKLLFLILSWTVGYWSCFSVTYAYNSYYWDNSIAKSLFTASLCWWVFGLFVICLMVLFSIISNSNSGVLLGVGGCVLTSYLLGIIPKAYEFVPTFLMDISASIASSVSADTFIKAIIISMSVSLVSIVLSVILFNKKQF